MQICKIQAGNYNAIIPDEAELAGTVRTLSKTNREKVKSLMEKIVKNISEIYDVRYDLYYRGKTFPVMNKTEYVDKVKESVKNIFTDGFVKDENFKIGGDDFCFFSENIPATFLIVGSANEDKSTQFPLHNPRFNVDEKVILKGAEAFSRIAIDYLNDKYD